MGWRIVKCRDSVASCAKVAELIEMHLGTLSEVGPENIVLDGVHIVTTWQIRLNCPSAVTMWLCVKLLSLLVLLNFDYFIVPVQEFMSI